MFTFFCGVPDNRELFLYPQLATFQILHYKFIIINYAFQIFRNFALRINQF